ncbi:MAG: ATP-binding protein [Candidatus Omnitrophica bacterium]|nr:ATP-binding protein [Candidatus Omnitrophota bacterium]
MIRDKFFDRRNYIEILQKRVGSLKDGYRQNIAIIGEENVGKTSIVYKFLDNFYDPRIITVFLEVRPGSFQDFAKRFIGALLYNFLLNSGLELKEEIDFLLAKSAGYIPNTALKIKAILNELSRRKKVNIVNELFSLPELIYQETGKFTVLFLDEFHNLESIGINNLYREWSKLLILQKNTLYVITSSMMFKTRVILSKQLSLLFGNFEVINVEPFDMHTSGRYLDHRLPAIKLYPGLKDFIINFTGGYPLYLELISDVLSNSIEGRVCLPARPGLASDDQNRENIYTNLADILEELLFNTSGILNQRFSNYIKRFLDSPVSNDYISILYLVASGRNRIKDIAHILHKQKKELASRINYLLELDAITRSGDFIKVSDRLFAYWMRFVYQEKIHSLSYDAKSQKEKFRDGLIELIQEFLRQSQKPLSSRIFELLQLFEDDLMQFERKKIRLNHFREVKQLAFNHRLLKEGLLGRSSESLWIMAIKPEAITEQDIAEFSRECKKYHHKSQRKIMVTLKEVDPNARLRALEEKVWTWDLNSLNQMLDLFSKPRVVA